MTYRSTKDVPVEVLVVVSDMGRVNISYASTSERFDCIADARSEYSSRLLHLVSPHDNLVMHVLGELGRAEGLFMAIRKAADGAQ